MEWFKITNIEQFVEATRVLVYNNFGSVEDDVDTVSVMLQDLLASERKELEEVLPQQESMTIFLEFCKINHNKKQKTKSYYITDKAYYGFIESLNSRLVSNMLSKMVNKGIIESAFDVDANDFVFWIKEDNDKPKNKKQN